MGSRKRQRRRARVKKRSMRVFVENWECAAGVKVESAYWNGVEYVVRTANGGKGEGLAALLERAGFRQNYNRVHPVRTVHHIPSPLNTAEHGPNIRYRLPLKGIN